MKKVLNLKFLIVLLLLAFCTQGSVLAQQSEIEDLQENIDELQQKVTQLEEKIARLEKILLSNKMNSLSSQSVINSNNWKSKQNWRMLEKGMSKIEVKQILGEPGKISTGSYHDSWYYPDALGGLVKFDGGKVEGWSEP